MMHCFPPALKVSEIPPHDPGNLNRVHSSILSSKASSILEKEVRLMVVVAEKELTMELNSATNFLCEHIRSFGR